MSPKLQVKLLRAIQERQITRVGDTIPAVNIRLITATHVDLQSAITSGRFREDFTTASTSSAFNYSPLRDRADDVICISNYLERYGVELNARNLLLAGIGVRFEARLPEIFVNSKTVSARLLCWPTPIGWNLLILNSTQINNRKRSYHLHKPKMLFRRNTLTGFSR